MRVLVTNDDGLHAPGLAHLAGAAARAGHDVLAVAPEDNRSGSGAAIGDLGEQSAIRCREMPLDGLAEVHAIALDATPALCVIATCLGAFGDPPELVLSGVNPGLNTGRSIPHSGTVGAVITAANFGISGVAVSIAGHESEVKNWGVAAELAVETARWVAPRNRVTTINLSVPDRAREDLEPACFGSLAPLGAIHTEIVGRDAEWLRLGFRETNRDLPAGSDSRLTAKGHVVLTPIIGIRADSSIELNDVLASLNTSSARGST